MKNWNKIGHYIATCASAALLASFATLATPKTASAATLSFDESSQQWVSDNEAEAVDQILNLDIGGKKYNVTFESKSIGSLLQEQQQGIGSFGYVSGTDAASAASAIMNALGDTFFTGYLERFGSTDLFIVIDEIWDVSWHRRMKFWWDVRMIEESDDALDGVEINLTGGVSGSFSDLVAVFEEVEEVASTPEPSLIFGLITLGGLMLGSRKSNFIFHQTIPPSKSDISP